MQGDGTRLDAGKQRPGGEGAAGSEAAEPERICGQEVGLILAVCEVRQSHKHFHIHSS